MNKVIARLDDVSLIYHEPRAETLAVSGISFNVKEGEFISLVGPSGCGKTSILSMLAGISEASSGEVRVLGARPEPATSDIGYMLQTDSLLDWRTIEGNVLLGLEVKHKLSKKTRSYAEELIEKYGLFEFSEHYPRQLSGGMRQKVALIRTLVFKPKLLLLDEPFSALDYQTRLLLADEVHSIIKHGGYTAVLVTHDISEAVSMSDRIIILTSRPATIMREIKVDLPGETPLERRSSPLFKDYFNEVWKVMMQNESFN